MLFDAPFLRQDPRFLLSSHPFSARLNSTPDRPVSGIGSVVEERWPASTVPSCDAAPAPGERLPGPSLPCAFDFSFSRHHSHYFTHPILHTLAAPVAAFLEYSTWHCLPVSSFIQRFPALLLAPSAPNQQTAAQMLTRPPPPPTPQLPSMRVWVLGAPASLQPNLGYGKRRRCSRVDLALLSQEKKPGRWHCQASWRLFTADSQLDPLLLFRPYSFPPQRQPLPKSTSLLSVFFLPSEVEDQEEFTTSLCQS